MREVIDNGNTTPPTTPDAWTPKLDGVIYCSPACGGKCKKSDFDTATTAAHTLVRQLGHGWEPHVWENLGWHYEAVKRGATVIVDDDFNYQASIRFELQDNVKSSVTETRETPRGAVNAVVNCLNARIKALQRALVSISPESTDGNMIEDCKTNITAST